MKDLTNKNNSQYNTLEEFEEVLLGLGLLKLPTRQISRATILAECPSYKDFVIKFILDYNHRFKTYKVTSNQPNINKCGKYRSAGDIFRLAKTYYPQVTLKDVIKHLSLYCKYQKVIYKQSSSSTYYKYIYSQICSNIHKRVYNCNYRYIVDNIRNLEINDNISTRPIESYRSNNKDEFKMDQYTFHKIK